MRTQKNEYFIGLGTMIMGYSVTIGLQHYYLKSKLSIYSAFSTQGFFHFGGYGYLPTASLALQYNLADWVQIKAGYFGGIHLGGTSGESGDDIVGLPFLGLSRKF